MFYSFSAGIDIRRQNLPSKVSPRAKVIIVIDFNLITPFILAASI